MLACSKWPLCNRGLWGVLAGTVLLVLGGCGGGYSGPTGTVSGTVTLGGQAVPEGCIVTFMATDGFTASAVVGSGGSYQLARVTESGQRTDQIPVASYSVSVSPPPQTEGSQENYEEMMEASAAGGEDTDTAATDAVIPDKYQDMGTSELSFDVADGSNTFDIELE